MSSPTTALELFYSYSHKDEELRDQLEEHLSMLKRDGVIKGWHDRRISGGSEWAGQIDTHLDSADIILLLVSSAFIASEYCYDIEVKRAMERHESKEARVIPIILRACDWQSAPFGKLQALPKDGMPVKQWIDSDVAFLDIAKSLRNTAKEISIETVTQWEAQPEGHKPDPYLLIPDLRVSFVPRKDRSGNDLVRLLHNELEPQRPRLVSLWGAGGVGKTAIAAEAVRGLASAFRNRIAWVSADGLTNFSLTTLLDGIASQLGHPDVRTLSLDPKKEQVRAIVKSSPTLIVLDNFETIEALERARCVDWLSKPPPCSALITTRDVIEDARNIPIEVMRPDEAQSFLSQLIAQAHDARAFAKLDRNRLIRTAESNPLVLQWIVGQIDLAQDPDEVLEDLRHGEGSAAERVFNRSFELKQLNNGGRALLLALSLFAPSATRKAIAEVSGLGKESDRRKFKEAVKSLSGLWLIHTTEESKRLALEGLTRELAKARLDLDPRGKTFRPRFVQRFLDYASFHSQPTPANLNVLEEEKDNILAAMDIAYELKNWTAVVSLMGAINFDGVRGLLTIRGYWDEAIRRGEQAIEAARALRNEATIARLAGNVAILRRYRGEYAAARKIHQDTLQVFQQLGLKRGVVVALNQLGTYSEFQGDWPEAQSLYDESLRISREIKDDEGIAASLSCLGSVAHSQGDLALADRLINESLSIRTVLGDQSMIAVSVDQLAALAQIKGEVIKARQLWERSLELKVKLGDQGGIAETLCDMAELENDLGEAAEAQRLGERSLHIVQKLGDQGGIAAALGQLGAVALDRGELVEARRLYSESLKIAQSLGRAHTVAIINHQLAVLTMLEGDYVAAEELLEASLVQFKKAGDRLNTPECLETLGRLRVIQGDLEAAEKFYHEALGIAEQVGMPVRIASIQRSLALLAEAKNDNQSAASLLRAALRVFGSIGSRKAVDAQSDLERVQAKSKKQSSLLDDF